MPYHVHPVLRAIEEINESESLIPALDTQAVKIFKAEESAGTRKKVVPSFFTRIVRGRTYTAS